MQHEVWYFRLNMAAYLAVILLGAGPALGPQPGTAPPAALVTAPAPAPDAAPVVAPGATPATAPEAAREPDPAASPAASPAAGGTAVPGVAPDPATNLGLSPEVLARLTDKQVFQLLALRSGSDFANRDRDEPAVEIIVPVAFFLTLLFGIAGGLFFSYRKELQRQTTVRLALERGATIPTELLVPRRRPRSDLRTGILLLAGGVGLLLFLLLEGEESWGVGLIPLLIGAGYLVAWRLERGKAALPAADHRELG